VAAETARFKGQFGLDDQIIGVGIDRIDYTKGIPDRFRAIDRLLEKYPQYRGKLVFIQANAPSRTHIRAYRSLGEEIAAQVDAINRKYATANWRPLICLNENLPPLKVMALRTMADFCVVSSLHDGMNLVAKEFVASRFDEQGVLILSRFTGAARELTDAVLINPYATDHFAGALKDAIEMPVEEKRQRMKKMREVVRTNNIFKWAADIITDLAKFEFGE
jgi:trehalose-6-phosphate synthase